MSTTLEKVHSDISLRLEELDPLVEEHRQLSAIAEKLGAAPQSSNGSKRAPRKASTGTPAKQSTTGKRGRPAGSGKRGQEVVDIVIANPGIKVADIAALMSIKPNYLYRVMPDLEKQGKVTKVGKGYEAAADVASEPASE